MGNILEFLKKKTPPDDARRLGRNEPCWCGSGKKYKHCHLERDQRHFSAVDAAACGGSS